MTTVFVNSEGLQHKSDPTNKLLLLVTKEAEEIDQVVKVFFHNIYYELRLHD